MSRFNFDRHFRRFNIRPASGVVFDAEFLGDPHRDDVVLGGHAIAPSLRQTAVCNLEIGLVVSRLSNRPCMSKHAVGHISNHIDAIDYQNESVAYVELKPEILDCVANMRIAHAYFRKPIWKISASAQQA